MLKNLLAASFLLLIAQSSLAFFEYTSKDLPRLCSKGKWDKVQAVVRKQKNPQNISDQALKVCVDKALCDKEIGLFNYFIGLKDGAINHASGSCMISTIKRGDTTTVSYALQKGFDVAQYFKGGGFIHFAFAAKNNFGMVELLLSQKEKKSKKPIINLEFRSKISGLTALGLALQNKNHDIAQILLDAGASLIDALYVAPHDEERFFSVLLPHEGHQKLVLSWLKQHGYQPIRDLLNDKNKSSRYKKGVINFLAHDLPSKEKNKILSIWKEYAIDRLEDLLSDESSSVSEDESSSVGESEDDAPLTTDKRSICLDLCDEDEEKKYINLSDCGHKICKGCFEINIAQVLSDKTLSLECPDKNCHKLIDSDILDQFNVTKHEKLDYQIRELEKELMDYKSFHHCHQAGCPGGSFTNTKSLSTIVPHFTCYVCGHKQCLTCGQYHPKTKTHDHRVHQNIDFIDQQIKKYIIKKCPNAKCKETIEKNEGCDHMTCKKCNYEFWWSSLKKY